MRIFINFIIDNMKICEAFNQPIKFECTVEKDKPEKLEMHYIKSLSRRGIHLRDSNKRLLHESCHFKVPQIYKKIK
jgi:hypothetical protein